MRLQDRRLNPYGRGWRFSGHRAGCRKAAAAATHRPERAGADGHGPGTKRCRPFRRVGAMTLRRPFRPLRPDLDKFLFATVGDEVDGVPLSVISALVRLGLDTWEEAVRLSSLSAREAAPQLARLIVELPGEAQEIARGLVRLLPPHDPARTPAAQVQIRPRYRGVAVPLGSPFLIVCFLVAAAALVSAVIHGGLPFGVGGP